MREKKRRPEARGWGRGEAGEARAGLKVEWAKDVQRVENLAERTNRLAEKEKRKPLHYALQEILKRGLEAVAVRNSRPSQYCSGSLLNLCLAGRHCGRSAPQPGEEEVSHGPGFGAAVTVNPWPTLWALGPC